MKKYNKLVRDGVLDHIESMSEPYFAHVATDEEYAQKLPEKLVEEAQEFLQNPTKEELADLLEVVEAIKAHNGWTTEDIEQIRLEKLEKRGGFNNRIILEES
jgi:predicted house-cleaning noncanonical NTP pyrophosphatase (MazG superfamily)